MVFRIFTGLYALTVGIIFSLMSCASWADEYFDVDDRDRLLRYTNPQGLSSLFRYDALDRLVQVDGPNDSAQFGYDSLSRHSWTDDEIGTVSYYYDPMNRLRAISFEIERPKGEPIKREIRYGYDDLGEVRALTLVGEGNIEEYQIEMFRDLAGRLQSAIIGGSEIRFRHQTGPSGPIVTRTLPTGMTTMIARDEIGLPFSITHAHHPEQDPFQSMVSSYRFDVGEVQITYTRGGTQDVRRYDLAQPPREAEPIPVDVSVGLGADMRILRRSQANKNTWYLNAPISRSTGLAIEVNHLGLSERAFVTLDDLSVEQVLGEVPVVFLERPDGLRSAPFESRFRSGVSLADSAPRRSFETGAAVRTAEIPLRYSAPVQTVRAAISVSANLTKQAEFVRKQLDARAPHNAVDHLRGPLKRLKPVGDRLETLNNVMKDFDALMQGDGSLQERLLRHGVVGETVKGIAKDILKNAARDGIPKIVVKGTTDIAFTLLRGEALISEEAMKKGIVAKVLEIASNPNIAESYLDTIAGSLVYQTTLIALGGPANPSARIIAAENADLAIKGVKFTRKRTADWYGDPGNVKGRRAPGATGQFLYQAASASLRDGVEMFLKINPSVFDTVQVSETRHRNSHISRRNRAYAEFQKLVESRDNQGMARMLRENSYIRKALMSAGISDRHILEVADSLDAPVGSVLVPDITSHANLAAIKSPGGIDLSLDAVFPSLGALEGAVIDPATGRVILVGDGDLTFEPIDPEILAVALIAAFRDDVPDPQFSLDPIEPRDSNSWQKAVYLPENLLSGTLFGQIMYEADLDLKLLAFGSTATYGPWQDIADGGATVHGPVEVWSSNRYQPMDLGRRGPLWPGFESLPEISLRTRGQESAPVRSRQWIVVERVELFEADGAIRFGNVKLGVRAQRTAVNAAGDLVDVEDDDPVAQAFAAQVSAEFDAVADQIPSFARLKEAVRALALAKWLRKSGATVDLDWAIELVNGRAGSVRQVSTLRWRHEVPRQELITNDRGWTIRTSIPSIEVSGGVDLSFEPVWLAPDTRTLTLESTTLAALKQSAEPTFPALDVDAGQRTAAMVLPVNSQGHEAWQRHQAGLRDGLELALDEDGRMVRARDMTGTRATYEWSEDGNLAATGIVTRDGRWKRYKVDGVIASFIETNRNGALREVRVSDSVIEFHVGDQLEQRLSATDEGRRLLVEHPESGMATEFVFDAQGKLIRLRRGHGRELIDAETITIDPHLADFPEDAVDTRKALEEIIDLHGLPFEIRMDPDGIVDFARFGASWAAELKIDPETGVGHGHVANMTVTVSHPENGITRIALIPSR